MDEDDVVPEKKPAKQTTLTATTSAIISQSKVDQLIVNFIVSYMEPLSIVEDQSFIDLVGGIHKRKVMTRKTLDGMYLYSICSLLLDIVWHVCILVLLQPLCFNLHKCCYPTNQLVTIYLFHISTDSEKEQLMCVQVG